MKTEKEVMSKNHFFLLKKIYNKLNPNDWLGNNPIFKSHWEQVPLFGWENLKDSNRETSI